MPLVAIVAQATPQQVECTNCGADATAIVGILLAGLAFVVSFWSLYVTALRRPKIDLDHVVHRGELAFPGWTEGLPVHKAADVQVWIVLVNTGAHPTFAETLELSESFACHPAKQCMFVRMERQTPHLRGEAGRVIEQPPISFERGDAEPYRLYARLFLDADVRTGEDMARRLRELDAVAVTVEWSYRRGRLLTPWRRETRHERETIRLDAGFLKYDAATHWRSYPDYHPFADELEA